MEIKAGYKETEVGIIPEDWIEVTVQDITATHKQGYYSTEHYVDSGTYIVRITDLMNPTINFNGMPKLKISKQDFDLYKINVGDFLFARSGSIGRYGIVYEEADAVFGSFIIRFTFNRNKILNEYFGYVYQTEVVKKQLLSITQGSSNININANNIKSLKIPLPSLPEQKAIAEALSDADALIEALEGLIAKKRQVKQGAMQELLSGKRRLPGFSVEWKWKTFGDVISKCFSGATPSRSRSDYFKGNIRWITSTELNYNVITDTAEKITPEAVRNTNLKMLPKNTFLMAITGLEAEGTRGRCGIVGEEATSNQSCMALFPTNELLVEYLFHYYVYAGDRLALEYCQGTKQQSYTAQTVKLLPIYLPPVPEQTAIAEILSDMDAEIAALEGKLSKAWEVKAGMMSVLLAGRIRLVKS